MKTNIRSKNTELTNSMKVTIDESLNQLEKYNFNIQYADVNVILEKSKKNHKFCIEYKIKVDYFKNPIVLKEKGEDFYKVISNLNEKTSTSLYRLHTKKVAKNRSIKEEQTLLEAS